jgi:phosphoheptose isomerase
VSFDASYRSSEGGNVTIVRAVEGSVAMTSSAPAVLEAVILAGGKGTRLRDVVADRPKPMAEVAGRPFLEWLLLSLRKQGVRRLVLSTGHLAEAIETYCGDGSRWDLEISYSREESPLGTAGAIRQALPQLEGDRFFVLNGDSFCPANLFQMFADHARHRARATMWLAQVKDCARYGRVELDAAAAITAFREKSAGEGPGLVNAGVYLFERDVFEPLPAGKSVSLEREVLPELVTKGLFGVRGQQPLLDIGTPDSYREAQSILPGMTGAPQRRPLAFIDRDGTIIAGHHHLTDPDQVALLPGAAEALRGLRALGLGLVVVTNQSVVGRGLVDEAGLGRVHARMLALLEAEGVHIDDIYHCPHRPEDGCRCRKPGRALVDLAALHWNGDPRLSFVIGDNRSDIELGQAVQATTVLVRTGYGAGVEGTVRPDHVVDDLRGAVSVVRDVLDQRRARALLAGSARTLADTADTCAPQIARAAALIAAAFQGGHKLLLCGNGGSAADCQHMAAEFVSRLTRDFDRPALPAIALTTDTSFLTAFANDCGFDGIFARQVEALGRPGDVLLGISTSGGSRNVVAAVEMARRKGLSVVTLTGSTGALAAAADVAISIPSSDTQHIQEAHIAVEHVVCDLVERQLFPRGTS